MSRPVVPGKNFSAASIHGKIACLRKTALIETRASFVAMPVSCALLLLLFVLPGPLRPDVHAAKQDKTPAKTDTQAKKGQDGKKDSSGGASRDLDDLKKSIDAQKQKERTEKERLNALTEKERSINKELAAIEDRIRQTTEKLQAQERIFSEIDSRERKAQSEYGELEKSRAATLKDLEVVLGALWPIKLAGPAAGVRGLESWDAVDRRFIWLSEIYKLAENKMRYLNENAEAITRNIALQEKLKNDAKEQLGRTNAVKDDLLRDKLTFLSGLKSVRAQRIEGEEELKRVIDTISKLNYRLKSLSGRNFDELKGRLPWPVQGRVEQAFNPSANPPHRGLSISTASAVQVSSIAWGKVVHNDVLRGFGRVLILLHGQNYYSLYAYLNESKLKVGEEVDTGQPLGRTGFYPSLNSQGLYFELRLGQKAVNPKEWLSAR